MLQKETEAVPEGNDPVLQQEEFGSGQPTLEEVFRMIEEALEDKMQEYVDDLRSMRQREARLEPDARQPRLAMVADGHAVTKTRERTEGAGTAVQEMHGASCSATRVEPGPTTNSTSFGMKVELPAHPCRDEVVVENRAAAPRSCLPSLEMRSPTVADWFTSHRQNLYSNKDHLQQVISSALLDRRGELKGDKFMDFKSTRLV